MKLAENSPENSWRSAHLAQRPWGKFRATCSEHLVGKRSPPCLPNFRRSHRHRPFRASPTSQVLLARPDCFPDGAGHAHEPSSRPHKHTKASNFDQPNERLSAPQGSHTHTHIDFRVPWASGRCRFPDLWRSAAVPVGGRKALPADVLQVSVVWRNVVLPRGASAAIPAPVLLVAGIFGDQTLGLLQRQPRQCANCPPFGRIPEQAMMVFG